MNSTTQTQPKQSTEQNTQPACDLQSADTVEFIDPRILAQVEAIRRRTLAG